MSKPGSWVVVNVEGSEGWNGVGKVTVTWSSGKTDLQPQGCPLITALGQGLESGGRPSLDPFFPATGSEGVCLRIKVASHCCVCGFMCVWFFVILFCFLFINCQPACQSCHLEVRIGRKESTSRKQKLALYFSAFWVLYHLDTWLPICRTPLTKKSSAIS